jgi:hypothetical protein
MCITIPVRYNNVIDGEYFLITLKLEETKKWYKSYNVTIKSVRRMCVNVAEHVLTSLSLKYWISIDLCTWIYKLACPCRSQRHASLTSLLQANMNHWHMASYCVNIVLKLNRTLLYPQQVIEPYEYGSMDCDWSVTHDPRLLSPRLQQ